MPRAAARRGVGIFRCIPTSSRDCASNRDYSPKGLQFGNKSHVTSSGECEIVRESSMELDVGRVRVWMVKVSY
jgi:hypothetical protein